MVQLLGEAQTGFWGKVTGFAVDFYSFLLLLTVIGIGDERKWHHKILITIGIFVNLWGVLIIQRFGWSEINALIN